MCMVTDLVRHCTDNKIWWLQEQTLAASNSSTFQVSNFCYGAVGIALSWAQQDTQICTSKYCTVHAKPPCGSKHRHWGELLFSALGSTWPSPCTCSGVWTSKFDLGQSRVLEPWSSRRPRLSSMTLVSASTFCSFCSVWSTAFWASGSLPLIGGLEIFGKMWHFAFVRRFQCFFFLFGEVVFRLPSSGLNSNLGRRLPPALRILDGYLQLLLGCLGFTADDIGVRWCQGHNSGLIAGCWGALETIGISSSFASLFFGSSSARGALMISKVPRKAATRRHGLSDFVRPKVWISSL